ncbi:unnamed protein product [Fraxinus pennsylvanica]|uniref:Uncharacterized protein n=1 Tax=Fraxinus pennsylvanica TaxID=56036 RepID=A0AAD1Z0W7_9LAMI|nr:unnamed protein product [Fraxinus pennsylvanica]
METEEELVAAAKQIMKPLEMKKNLMDDSKKILSNLCMQLCDITREKEQKDEGVKENDGLNEIEQQLDLIQDKVLSWERDQAIIWDCGPEEAYEAHDVFQMAMARLEEEFKHLLVQNRQPFELEHMSFRSSEDDIMEAGSVILLGDDSLEVVVQRDISEKLGRLSIELAKQGRSGLDDLLLSTDGGKHDYDWLLTPLGTPLVPPLDINESRSTLVAPRSSPSIRSTSTMKASSVR